MKCAVKMKDLGTKRFSVNILYLKEIPKLSQESISISYLIKLAQIFRLGYRAGVPHSNYSSIFEIHNANVSNWYVKQ